MAFRPTFFVGGNGMSPFQVSTMTDDEIITIVTAHKEGKQIQLRCSNIPEWTDVVRNEPSWNFEMIEYRVAPEPRKPREWWVCIDNGEIKSCLTRDFYQSIPSSILVREVMDVGT